MPDPLHYERRDPQERRPPRVAFRIVRWSVYLALFVVLEVGAIVLMIILALRSRPWFGMTFLVAMFAGMIWMCIHEIRCAKRCRQNFVYPPSDA